MKKILLTLLIFLMASSAGYAGTDIQPLGIEQLSGSVDIDGLTGNTTLNAATGNEVAYTLNYTTNKATSGNDTGLLVNMTDTASPGTSLLQDWQVGGASKACIQNNGYVGIGTTTPGAVLEVSNGAMRIGYSTGSLFIMTPSSTGTNGITLTSTFYSGGNGPMKFNVGASDRMIIEPTNGSVGIGTTSPNANAMLDITSTTRAFMPPRMTTTQRDAIGTPTEGMVIYNITTHVLDFYNGTVWGPV